MFSHNSPDPQIPTQAGFTLTWPGFTCGTGIFSYRKSCWPWNRRAFMVALLDDGAGTPIFFGRFFFWIGACVYGMLDAKLNSAKEKDKIPKRYRGANRFSYVYTGQFQPPALTIILPASASLSFCILLGYLGARPRYNQHHGMPNSVSLRSITPQWQCGVPRSCLSQ